MPPAAARGFGAALLHYLRPHRSAVFLLLLLLLAEVGAQLLRPWPFKFVIDFLTQGEGGAAMVHGPLPRAVWESLPLFLVFVSASVLAISLVEGLAAYLAAYRNRHVAGQVAMTMRCRAFAHVQRLGLQYHYTRPTGELLDRVLGDVRQIETFLGEGAASILAVAAELVGMIAILFWMDWQMALVALVLGPVVFWVTASFTRSIRDVSRAQRHREGQLTSMTQETLASIALVKAFSREPFVDEIFERENAANLKASLAAAAVEAKFAPVVRVLMAVGSVIVLCFGVVRVREGVLSAGDLWVFLSYFRNLRGPLKELSNALRRLARAEVRWERVRDLFDTALPTDDRTRLPAPRFTGHVTMRDVDFEYTPGVPVLRRLSLEVAAGEGVAIIGATGAGKSTLVSLIAALYEPTRGTVAIDRHDLATLRPDSVREQIAFVLQETVLFATTVRENIAYGRLDATEDEIVAAARAARIHDFVMTLPEGYETIVGERGATLSGGQRQRIAIARAILRDARILILDEPTTGLDLQTEREVWEQLKTLMRGRTTVLISHHPHLARDMDRVYHLADGQVVEERNVA